MYICVRYPKCMNVNQPVCMYVYVCMSVAVCGAPWGFGRRLSWAPRVLSVFSVNVCVCVRVIGTTGYQSYYLIGAVFADRGAASCLYTEAGTHTYRGRKIFTYIIVHITTLLINTSITKPYFLFTLSATIFSQCTVCASANPPACFIQNWIKYKTD